MVGVLDGWNFALRYSGENGESRCYCTNAIVGLSLNGVNRPCMLTNHDEGDRNIDNEM